MQQELTATALFLGLPFMDFAGIFFSQLIKMSPLYEFIYS